MSATDQPEADLSRPIRCSRGTLARPAFASRYSIACCHAFGRDPRHLGGTIGVTTILHTWGQSLAQHLHLHCVVTGGTLATAGCTRRLPPGLTEQSRPA